MMSRSLVAAAAPVALLGLVVGLGLGLGSSSCTTDSETPNAGYSAGVSPGTLNNRCRSDNSCVDADALVCIVDDDGDNPTCRARCLVSATPDACGAGFRCVRLANSQDNGACIPIGQLGDPCGICDTDLACVGAVCRAQCELVDGGSDCPAGETCASVDGGPEVCSG